MLPILVVACMATKFAELEEKASIWLAAQEIIDKANRDPYGKAVILAPFRVGLLEAKPGDNPKDIVDKWFAEVHRLCPKLIWKSKDNIWHILAISGDNVVRLAQEMIDRANYFREIVVCEINKVKVEVNPGDELEDVVGQYFAGERIAEGKPIIGDPDEPDPNIVEVNRLIAEYLKRRNIKI